MSNLRLILILAGAVLIAGIWGFEVWRRRREGGHEDPFAGHLDGDYSLEDLPVWKEDEDWEVGPVRTVSAQAQRAGDGHTDASAAEGRHRPATEAPVAAPRRTEVPPARAPAPHIPASLRRVEPGPAPEPEAGWEPEAGRKPEPAPGTGSARKPEAVPEPRAGRGHEPAATPEPGSGAEPEAAQEPGARSSEPRTPARPLPPGDDLFPEALPAADAAAEERVARGRRQSPHGAGEPRRTRHVPSPPGLFDDAEKDTTAVPGGQAPDGLPPIVARRESDTEDVAALSHIVPGAQGNERRQDTAEGRRNEVPPQPRSSPEPAPAAGTEAPPAEQVFALTVMARPGRRFVGHQLRAALESVEMRHGDMQIFHYHPGCDISRAPLFSAVNVLKPGHFDLEAMGEMATTGVALFMRTGRGHDGPEVFETMLDTARHLAERLGGEVCDEARGVLTARRLERLREEVARVSGASPDAG